MKNSNSSLTSGIVFDLGFGGPEAPSPLKLQFLSNYLSGVLGEEKEQKDGIRHVTFCGVLDHMTEPKRDVLGKVMTHAMTKAMKEADQFFGGITQNTETVLLSGRGDIGTGNIPLRPVHPLLYKQVITII